MIATSPNVMILAGANGAGKSTIAPEFFASHHGALHFVNADTIAKGLSAFRSEEVAFEAGRIMLAHLKALAARRESFAFETTLATRTFAGWIEELKQQGYLFRLFFVWVPSADIAVQRVQERVHIGGHHVPEETVRRRYQRGLANFFHLYRPLADSWKFFGNIEVGSPVLIAEGEGTNENVWEPMLWDSINKEQSR